jgi:nicotinamide/nicotinate riboside kinase
MAEFARAMEYIRTHDGQLPDTLRSIQHQNTIGPSGVSDEVIKRLHDEFEVDQLLRKDNTDVLVCFVDGFLLYSDQAVIDQLDLRLLVRAPYEKLKARRERREGYVTQESSSSHGNH